MGCSPQHRQGRGAALRWQPLVFTQESRDVFGGRLLWGENSDGCRRFSATEVGIPTRVVTNDCAEQRRGGVVPVRLLPDLMVKIQGAGWPEGSPWPARSRCWSSHPVELARQSFSCRLLLYATSQGGFSPMSGTRVATGHLDQPGCIEPEQALSPTHILDVYPCSRYGVRP